MLQRGRAQKQGPTTHSIGALPQFAGAAAREDSYQVAPAPVARDTVAVTPVSTTVGSDPVGGRPDSPASTGGAPQSARYCRKWSHFKSPGEGGGEGRWPGSPFNSAGALPPPSPSPLSGSLPSGAGAVHCCSDYRTPRRPGWDPPPPRRGAAGRMRGRERRRARRGWEWRCARSRPSAMGIPWSRWSRG